MSCPMGVAQQGVAHNEDRPFFLYAIHVDDTPDGLVFGISPAPNLRVVGAGPWPPESGTARTTDPGRASRTW